MRRLLVVALHSLALHAELDSEPGFEYYAGAAGPWSSEFQVTLHHAGRSASRPHWAALSRGADLKSPSDLRFKLEARSSYVSLIRNP